MQIVLFTLLHGTFNKTNYTVSQKTVAINKSEYEKVAGKTDNTSAGRANEDKFIIFIQGTLNKVSIYLNRSFPQKVHV